VLVLAGTVTSGDVPSTCGTVIAYNNVIVRSQTTGQLVKMSFQQVCPYQASSIKWLPTGIAIRPN
jgi:hypothetical protein